MVIDGVRLPLRDQQPAREEQQPFGPQPLAAGQQPVLDEQQQRLLDRMGRFFERQDRDRENFDSDDKSSSSDGSSTSDSSDDDSADIDNEQASFEQQEGEQSAEQGARQPQARRQGRGAPRRLDMPEGTPTRQQARSSVSLLSLFPSKKQRKELKANSSAKIPTFNGTKGKVFDDYLMDFKSVVQSRGLPDYTKGWVLNTIHVPMDAEGASITQFKLNMPDHPLHGKVLRKSGNCYISKATGEKPVGEHIPFMDNEDGYALRIKKKARRSRI